jgi:hypothetical protein
MSEWEIDMTGTVFIVGVFVTAAALSLWIDWMGETWGIVWWMRGVIWMGMLIGMLVVILWIIGAFR